MNPRPARGIVRHWTIRPVSYGDRILIIKAPVKRYYT